MDFIQKNQKNIVIAIITLIVLVMGFFWYSAAKNTAAHVDTREVACSKQTIDSVEFNTDTNACFSIKISACQKPTYPNIGACENANLQK